MKTKAVISVLAIISMMACIARGQAQAEGVSSGESAVSGVLIYSDQSPGALVYGDVWRGVAESNGEAVTVVTDATEFATKLAAGDWSDVHVVARYAPGEPAYGAALREFSSAHPDTMVQMFLWHDNGTSPTADTAVIATMANFLWSYGRTTMSYTFIGIGGNPNAGNARSVPGLVFPDFSGIVLRNPKIIFRVPASQAAASSKAELIQAVIGMITGKKPGHAKKPGHQACLNTFLEAVAACQSQHATAVQQCNDLYGPHTAPPADPGNPTQLAACINLADSDNASCLATAAHVYGNCILLCDRNTTVQQQLGRRPRDDR